MSIRFKSIKMMRYYINFIFLVVMSTLVGCANQEGVDVYKERPIGHIYEIAMSYLEKEEYIEAATEFLEVERQYPYSEWAEKSIMMAAYSYFKMNDHNQTIIQCERYISLYPNSPNAAYASYLIGLSYYLLIPNIGRDQEFSMKSLEQFQILIKRYPNSEYVNDAKLKMDLTYDHLAGEEMEIGRYYLKKDLFIAAINRFKAVVTGYQTTIHIEEALARLVESYMALGIISEAQTAAAILGYNYPGSEWYKDSYNLLQSGGLSPKEDNNSWISKTWRSVNPI